jgi:hypothetical protein
MGDRCFLGTLIAVCFRLHADLMFVPDPSLPLVDINDELAKALARDVACGRGGAEVGGEKYRETVDHCSMVISGA